MRTAARWAARRSARLPFSRTMARTTKNMATRAAAPTIHQMSLTMTQMISASTNKPPNPPPEFALDLLMPRTYAAAATFNFGRADAESHSAGPLRAILRLLAEGQAYAAV